jgi:hypothetical protein
MTLNNGRRVEVDLPGFTGLAGLVEHSDRDVISFPGRPGGVHAKVGAEITVEGRSRIILSIATSPFLRNFKVLELAK